MRFCPECGGRYDDDATFCPMDGARLGDPVHPSPELVAAASRSASAGQGSPSGLHWRPVGSPSPSEAQASPPAERSETSDEDPEEPLIGVILGDRYRVDERIGVGGMGIVYRATHVLIGRKLAIKVLRAGVGPQAEVADRFALEAKVASAIKHPNVVDVLDYGTTPMGSPYCVMEFLVGRSLAREIRELGKLDPIRALAIGRQIAMGLAAAHAAGVVHRDLKPENVFLVPADEQTPEQVKILDFGIARVVSRKTRLTAVGSVVGTPEYMSPEQARGDEVDARSDIYALGVVLFEALSGAVPLCGDNLAGTLTKQVFELAPPIREIDPRFAHYPSIEAALARMLAKNRDERPATALDAARLLETAEANDLGTPTARRERAALEGWSAPSQPDPDQPRPRRSTVMIGSGSVTSAHEVVADGPTTGSFAAKNAPSEAPHEEPSIIVREGKPTHIRPARILQADAITRPGPVMAPTPSALTPTASPAHPPRPREAIGSSFVQRHLALILVGVGAAICAALVTIGFFMWWQGRQPQNSSGETGMKANEVERRSLSDMVAHQAPIRASRQATEPLTTPENVGFGAREPANSPAGGSVEAVAITLADHPSPDQAPVSWSMARPGRSVTNSPGASPRERLTARSRVQ